MKNDHTTARRRCSECGQPLPPPSRRGGRPQQTCSDDRSPDGWCRRRRKHRLDNARRLHRYVVAHTYPDLIPGAVTVADVVLDYDGEAPRDLRTLLGDAGYSIPEMDATSSAYAVSAWEDEQRFLRRHAADLAAVREAVRRREVAAVIATMTEEERAEAVRRRVAERVARARANPA